VFTGLIETTGTVLSVEERAGARRIALEAPGIHLRTGDSIAVSGVCLTAVDLIEGDPLRFHADLAAETIARTSLSSLAPGSTVNLELPTPAGAPLGGHVVQGHVDSTGKLLSLRPILENLDPALTDWRLRVAIPQSLRNYMVEKGSIAIEGISLTIAAWKPGTEDGDVVEVAIIPHTYARTNLHTLQPGQPLNLEADVLLKFLEQRQTASEREPEPDLTVEFLVANGY
jgi:riboflavin synthase